MRNRYIVFVVMAVLAIVLIGCTRNPEAAKRKYVESGMKYMEQKKYDSAVIQFKKALQVDPRYADANNADGYLLLGNSLLGQKHQQDAVDAFTKAISLKPNSADAYLNRGVLYAYMKQDASAEEDMRKAISLDPQKLPAYANLAGFYLYKKDPKKAEEVYRLAIQNNPDSPVPYLRLAGLMLSENRKAEGEQVIQQLRDKQPTSAEVAGAVGDYYLASRNPEGAIK